jgi:curved DNA-binding protein CbpA
MGTGETLMRNDYYAILGVPQDATQRQIDVIYRARMRELESGDFQKQPLQDVQEAYAVLSNPNQRTAYDKSLSAQKQAIDVWFSWTRTCAFGRSHRKSLAGRRRCCHVD